MFRLMKNHIQKLSTTPTEHINRYGLAASLLVALVELAWAASLVVPVLYVISVLFTFSNAWLSILPGFLGALSFLVVLA